MGRHRTPVVEDYVSQSERYQRDVLAGDIDACKWVKLACQRQVRDLKRQRTKAFPYYFDREAGNDICHAMEQFPHIKGPLAKRLRVDENGKDVWNTITLEPWQCFIQSTALGWKRLSDEMRRFRIALILVPRKNSKSTMAATTGLYMLGPDGESGADVCSAATRRDQAKIISDAAREMARRSPYFCDHFGITVGAQAIIARDTAGKFEALSADANSLDGLNIHAALIDELHAHKTRHVWDVLETATGARSQPLLYAVTTAGVDTAGICFELLTYLHKILDGVIQDETFFGINYTIDTEPYTDILQSSRALRGLEEICQCKGVSHTQIERYWQEACAKHAMTSGIGTSWRSGAQSTQNVQSGRAECVPSATSSGSSTAIQITSAEPLPKGRNGRSATRTRSERLISDGACPSAIESRSFTSSDSPNTDSRESNTTVSMRSRADDARSATKLRADVYTSITATLAAASEASSARNATALSAFSETLKNVCAAHSPTCSARKARVELDGTVAIDRLGDDWRTEAAQRKANPNFGVSVYADDLARKAKKAEHSPAAINNFLTKHLNVWVKAETTWLPAEDWRACTVPSFTLEACIGNPCWIVADLAEVRDIATVMALFKMPEGKFAAFWRYYLPEDTVTTSPNALYSGWVHKGWLTSTLGNVADYQRIEDEIVALVEQCLPREVAFDRALASRMMQNLQARLGEDTPVVVVPQNIQTIDPAMAQVEELVFGRKLQHNGDEIAAWMASNVVVVRNHKGEIYPRKAGGKDSHNKIDGMFTLLMGISRAMAPSDEDEDRSSYYDGRGVLVI
jgi:phage terminase large subunit-like protein